MPTAENREKDTSDDVNDVVMSARISEASYVNLTVCGFEFATFPLLSYLD